MLDITRFGTRLKSAVKESGHTQKQLSEKLRINQDTITNYVKGTIPRADILYSICELINVSANYLLTGESKEEKIEPVETIYASGTKLKGALREAIIEGSNSENKEMSLNLTRKERDLVLAFRQFDDFDKEMVEDVFRNISKRIEKMNPQISYTYTPGEEDAAAEEAAEYIVKKHA